MITIAQILDGRIRGRGFSGKWEDDCAGFFEYKKKSSIGWISVRTDPGTSQIIMSSNLALRLVVDLAHPDSLHEIDAWLNFARQSTIEKEKKYQKADRDAQKASRQLRTHGRERKGRAV